MVNETQDLAAIATHDDLRAWLEANGPPTTRRAAFNLAAHATPETVDAVAEVLEANGQLRYDLDEMLEKIRVGFY